jgi:hypothetical protein
MSYPPSGPYGYGEGQPGQPVNGPVDPYTDPPAPGVYGTPQSAPPASGGYGQPYSAPPADAYGQPQSVPPAHGGYGQPQSGAPYGQPMSAPPQSGAPYGQQQHSAPPMSAPPMSAPPGSAPPYGAPAAPAAKSGAGRNVLVLAIVAGLLLVLSGVMTGLYVAKSSDLDATERTLTSRVAERDTTITTNKTEIDRLTKELQTAKDKLGNVEQDLTGTKNDRDQQLKEKQVIAKCLDQLTTALSAAASGNRTAYNNAIKGLDKVCNEAEKYL